MVIEIKDMVPKVKSKTEAQLFSQVMNDLQSLNKIAVLKLEDTVIRGILKGNSKNKILKELKDVDNDITMKDIEDFIILYKDTLYNAKHDIEKAYNRRLVRSQEGLTNNLSDLALKASTLVDQYNDQEDNTNAVAAIRVAADIFMKMAKLEGHFDDKPEINVNMQMDKLINQVSTSDSDFKKQIRKIVDSPDEETIIDAEVVTVDDGDREEN